MDLSFTTESTVRRIERVTLYAGVAVGLSIFGLGGVAFATTAAKRSAIAHAESAKAKAAQDRRDANAAPKREPRLPARIEDQVGAVQARLGAAAAKSGVSIAMFDAGTDTAPFASRYGAATVGSGWMMASAEVQMTGPVAGVYRTLRSLRALPIPTEIVELALRPIATASADGSPVTSGTVEASVTLSIVVRAADAPNGAPAVSSGTAAGGSDANRK